ncbi:sulfate/molybdate ABC transporter ATP-binding protein [Paludisphaera sp.]|uniref:sulfate/molybdate ABC transporter ATP-binding protein n=1 Tax=Paludisphaera sp. TaxID=2017432 RepID=UPI00301D37BD
MSAGPYVDVDEQSGTGRASLATRPSLSYHRGAWPAPWGEAGRPGNGEKTVAIEVRGLSKKYGSFQAVDDVSFSVQSGQLVALLGPSGSGKSTILRTIAGLETADSGSVMLTGEDATDLPVQRRGVGFVFQHYALFRHMTVRENIGFGLKIRGVPRAEVRRRADELLDLIQLGGYANRYPSQLSGGQRQRIALARALAPRPKVLLLDEPFGALDAKVRDELRTWLRRLHDEVHVTSLFVTHDQREAFEVSDQIVVLADGKVQQIGPPQTLYEQPANPFVAGFLGAINVLPLGSLKAGSVGGGPSDWLDRPPAEHAEAYVRPHDLDVHATRDGKPYWPAIVERITPLGGVVRLDLRIAPDRPLHIEAPRNRALRLGFEVGDEVYVTPRHLNVYDRVRGSFDPVDVHRAIGLTLENGAGI